jgi:hypothetical protein
MVPDQLEMSTANTRSELLRATAGDRSPSRPMAKKKTPMLNKIARIRILPVQSLRIMVPPLSLNESLLAVFSG